MKRQVGWTAGKWRKTARRLLATFLNSQVGGSEKSLLNTDESDFHKAEYMRLMATLEEAAAKSSLPNEPTARDLLNDLLVRLRLKTAST